jgi:hypothetical protein
MAHQNFINMLDNHDSFYLWHEDHVSTIEGSKIKIKECVNKEDFTKLFNFLFENKKFKKLTQTSTYYLALSGERVIACFSLNIKEKTIVLPWIYIKDSSSAEILHKEIEDMIFRKFNPCTFKIAAKPQYFSNSYQKVGKYYIKKL